MADCSGRRCTLEEPAAGDGGGGGRPADVFDHDVLHADGGRIASVSRRPDTFSALSLGTHCIRRKKRSERDDFGIRCVCAVWCACVYGVYCTARVFVCVSARARSRECECVCVCVCVRVCAARARREPRCVCVLRLYIRTYVARARACVRARSDVHKQKKKDRASGRVTYTPASEKDPRDDTRRVSGVRVCVWRPDRGSSVRSGKRSAVAPSMEGGEEPSAQKTKKKKKQNIQKNQSTSNRRTRARAFSWKKKKLKNWYDGIQSRFLSHCYRTAQHCCCLRRR